MAYSMPAPTTHPDCARDVWPDQETGIVGICTVCENWSQPTPNPPVTYGRKLPTGAPIMPRNVTIWVVDADCEEEIGHDAH